MFKLEKLSDKAILTIHGFVGGMYLDSENVQTAFDEIAKSKLKEVDFHLHTYGGGVFEGNLICNWVENFCANGGIVHFIIDGVAASMGSIMLPSGSDVSIADNGFVMIHAPRGGAWGTAKDLIQNAKLLQSMQRNFAKRLALRTGKTEDDINKWFDGTDYWFDAREALELKIVDFIVPARVKNIAKFDKTEARAIGAKAMYERFAACMNPIINQNEKSEMKKEDLIERYKLTGVTAQSTDDEVLAAFDAKIAEGAQAKQQAMEQAKKAIENLVAKAVTDQLITKEQSAQFIADGEKLGIERLGQILAALKPYKPVAAQIMGKGGNDSNGSSNNDYSWDDFQDKDIAALEAMPKTDPERFKALYKAKYGVEPEL